MHIPHRRVPIIIWAVKFAKKYMRASKSRQENDLLFLHVSYPICKSLDVSTDFLVDRHTWTPHGKGRVALPSYRCLARRQVGSEASRKPECLLEWIHTRSRVMRRTLRQHKKRYTERIWAFIKKWTRTAQQSWMCRQAHTFPAARLWRCQVTLLGATFTSTWPEAITTVYPPCQPV